MTTDLIRNALETICDLANSHMQNIDRRADRWVILTSLVDNDGSPNQAVRDKIVITAYNITQEATVGSYRPTVDDGFAAVAPPIHINAHLMVMARFAETNYAVGLAALSRIIGYFQQTPYFTPSTAPGLASDIDRLTLDMDNLSTSDVHAVTTMLGTRYLPSVFYKLRMIPFGSSAM